MASFISDVERLFHQFVKGRGKHVLKNACYWDALRKYKGREKCYIRNAGRTRMEMSLEIESSHIKSA